MESGTGKMFSRITSCTNENEKQNLYQQIKSQIEEDGLAEAAIDYVLTVFCSAIDWKMESVRETSGSNGSSYQEEISYGERGFIRIIQIRWIGEFSDDARGKCG